MTNRIPHFTLRLATLLISLLTLALLIALPAGAPPSKRALAAENPIPPSDPTLAFAALNTQSSVRSSQLFVDAATAYDVPADLLRAIAYHESRWQPRDGTPDLGHGY